MNKIIKNIWIVMVAIWFVACDSEPDSTHYPNVILTGEAVKAIRAEQAHLPLLKQSIDGLQKNVELEMMNGIEVPIPKDPAGGYTHLRHKQNYMNMYGAGVLWQVTGEARFANYVRDMLLAYAELYPTLEVHPVKASYAPGRLFWQQLNEAVWLVYVSQAYDCIAGILTAEQKELIENELLVPYADFLSVENPKVFNRVHNHGVWAAAAVGMTGFAIDNEELVNRAFNGVETGPKEEVGAGFLVQLTQLFSPDGYYTEGPYYQRYAMLPYLLFAQAIDNNRPEMKIFEYRDNILQKAALTTLQLTNTNGQFFPINDALKSMSYMSTSLVHAVDFVYGLDESQKELLSIARQQGEVIICEAGLKVARAIANGEARLFKWESKEFRDGPEGKQGAFGVLRSNSGKNSQTVTMKYASQGMGHGHFDRLTISFYDQGKEILQDYGAARYVNVEYKHGGRYLPENKTWARQTIAHNTLVVDKDSQSEGNVKTASSHHSEPWVFDASKEDVKVMSAKENKAYEGVNMHRTIALLNLPEVSEDAIILDLYRVESEAQHKYHLPYYYKGQMMHTNVDYKAETTALQAMGKNDGYQHLWQTAEGLMTEGTNRFVWLNEDRFYTLTTEAQTNDKLLLTRIGAGDPEFSLRNEPAVIFERDKTASTLFASAIEAHGNKHPVTELVSGLKGHVAEIKTLINNSEYTLVQLAFANESKVVFAICNNSNDQSASHQLMANGQEYNWTGVCQLFK
ncbi:alginate lyase family protein [Carboxylicivirga sediminis]|uniref:Alginate lyase family protein n=1 Tax=Carboxylicivirga sediminis TaxID=2006564 RepID=A0A941J074_9BACT|nr:alginate lyase family protein [Carboxylicivirga sediminis]MBR8537222.1 alginate lyase family protein [Carboxylicivirga sediminis]